MQSVVVEGWFSVCRPVTSGVPLGSELGTLLLDIYFNDIHKDVQGITNKFANDTKLGDVVETFQALPWVTD